MSVVEEQYASILVPHDHRNISQMSAPRLRRLACGIGLPAMVVTMGWIDCCLLSGIPKVLFVTRREPGLV